METLSGPSLETASSTLAATTTPTSTDRSTTTNLTEDYSSDTTTEVVGIVTDVVPARKFGFISVLDRTATNGGEHDSNSKDHLSAEGTNAPAPTTTASQQPRVKEKVFFHFSDVVASNHHHSEHKNNNNKSSPVLIKKGDEVKMNIAVVSKAGAKKKRVAVNVTVVRRPAPASDNRREKANPNNNATKKNQHAPASGGGGESKTRSADLCQGWILMEPSYTSLGSSHRNTHKKISSAAAAEGDNHNKMMSPNSRWKTSDEEDGQLHATKSTTNEDGCILVLKDPNGYFSSSSSTTSSSGDGTMKSDNKEDSSTELENVDSNVSNKSTTNNKQRLCQISYNKSDVHRMASTVHGTPPRRGDLVSFARSSKGGPKDVRVLKRGAARFVKGTLVHIDVERNKATFVMNSKGGATTEKSRPGKGSRKNNVPPPINIHLSDLVGCQGKVLNEGEPVEGMMVGGFLYGITRTKDLYIASTVTPPSSEGGSGGGSTGTGERRRLNLTVKKELQSLGGKIIAQSSMAKGPDGTDGFAESWTSRRSLFPDGVFKEE